MPYQPPTPPTPPGDPVPPADGAGDNIIGLQAELFATLRGLRKGELDIDRAKAISEVAQTIINSAKVQVEHARVTGGDTGAGFLRPTPNGTRRITHG